MHQEPLTDAFILTDTFGVPFDGIFPYVTPLNLVHVEKLALLKVKAFVDIYPSGNVLVYVFPYLAKILRFVEKSGTAIAQPCTSIIKNPSLAL